MASDDDDETLVKFLESDFLSETSDQEEEIDDPRNLGEEDYGSEDEMRKEEEENEEAEEEEVNKMLIEESYISCCEDKDNDEGDERVVKRRKVKEVENKRAFALTACNMLPSVEVEPASLASKKVESSAVKGSGVSSSDKVSKPKIIKPASLGKVPPELFRGILKFLSSEDLVSCSLACRFLNLAASDESLWRRLYSLRWGPLPPETLRVSAWKKLYIQRDEKDMEELVRNCPPEFKEYYKQMQTAKRSQAPLPSQVIDDLVIVDKTLTDQVSTWKRSRGLTDDVVADHTCSGATCTYFQIGDAFICEKTGNVHVCGDTCKDVDSHYEIPVCTISGYCFDRIPSEEDPEGNIDIDHIEEAEVFTGSGCIARAFQLGYECADEEELAATWATNWRFC